MFRASLRSLSDPLRGYACSACLARTLGCRVQARLFHSTRLSRAESGDGNPEGTLPQAAQGTAQAPEKPQKQKTSKTTKKPSKAKTTNTPSKTKKVSTKSKKRQKIRELPPASKTPPHRPDPDDKSTTPGIESSVQSAIDKLDERSEDKQTSNAPRPFPQPPKFMCGSIENREHGKANSKHAIVKAVQMKRQAVPRLSYGLQRVLFNPGVYHLRDPRSRVFNFDPYLGSIMPVTEFDFAALKEYITSSKDDFLRNLAIKYKKKYVGSSSSMTSVLSHFHYLLSAWRPLNFTMLSKGFREESRNFTRLTRAPAAMFLRYQDGVYAIDADKEFDSANILMNLGKSMEKLLTMPKKEFERYRRSHENKITAEEEAAIPEAYHYSTMGDFMMRSQLDAYDSRLPGTGMFDLKTRAVVSIRMDARNFEKGLGYQIKNRLGALESYEREYFDMIRAAFLKYSLQVRIGRMDGIFVAFHNIERIFGFQYISLPEMDESLHGQSDTALGDAEFRLSLALWNTILNKATAKFPKRSLRFHFETRDTQVPFMYIFAEPVTDEEIHAIQTKNKAEIDAYQQRILNLDPVEDHENTPEPSSTEPSSTESTQSTQSTESTESKDNKNTVNTSSENVSINSIEDASTASSDGAATDETEPEPESETPEPEPEPEREVFALLLVIKNHVNGKPVERPTRFKSKDSWTVEYELSEVDGKQVQSLYKACMKRRERLLTAGREDDADGFQSKYMRKLHKVSRQGRKYRQKQDELDRKHGVTVLDGVKWR